MPCCYQILGDLDLRFSLAAEVLAGDAMPSKT